MSLIYEMQTGMAYGYANWKIGNDPDLIEAFPAQELVRVRQAKVPRNWRVRWDAAGGEVGWEGAKRSPMVALKSSPIWRKLSRFDNPWPPFDYNSGMWVEDVSWEDAARLGLVKRDEAVRPQDQSLLDQTEVSVESLSPEVRELLDRHFEGQVEIRDGKLRWIQQPSGQGQILESTPNDKPSTMGAPYGKQAGANKGAGAMADARRALESAEADTRGGGRTTPAHDESRSERVARIEREERRILSWAGQRGLIASALPQADDLHNEHGIHYDETSDKYIKFTRADKHQGYGIALG
ncbi:MAG TPA: hypothetical protein PLI95_09060, partial [Polyangiaceae bacterium]|nr:hypothetical protein [Polyangiaceae bacterium]